MRTGAEITPSDMCMMRAPFKFAFELSTKNRDSDSTVLTQIGMALDN
ncbi:hypothetical protein DSCOOX_28400 [Desulfosarcina ovata subsp. ovata]|uniref:Uncharacterized protein n=1 Tax=Desulfosarcina ovata subsp. ovata TaxID=2752305 RepID=A0A5K8ACJ7_9BACT|nr:hypothetical protein DSCOOX_28400 [Desulfosarcina ovata subsp. ovata]